MAWEQWSSIIYKIMILRLRDFFFQTFGKLYIRSKVNKRCWSLTFLKLFFSIVVLFCSTVHHGPRLVLLVPSLTYTYLQSEIQLRRSAIYAARLSIRGIHTDLAALTSALNLCNRSIIQSIPSNQCITSPCSYSLPIHLWDAHGTEQYRFEPNAKSNFINPWFVNFRWQTNGSPYLSEYPQILEQPFDTWFFKLVICKLEWRLGCLQLIQGLNREIQYFKVLCFLWHIWL